MGPGSAQPGAMSPCPRYTIASPQPSLSPCLLDGPQPFIAHLLAGPLRQTYTVASPLYLPLALSPRWTPWLHVMALSTAPSPLAPGPPGWFLALGHPLALLGLLMDPTAPWACPLCSDLAAQCLLVRAQPVPVSSPCPDPWCLHPCCPLTSTSASFSPHSL